MNRLILFLSFLMFLSCAKGELPTPIEEVVKLQEQTQSNTSFRTFELFKESVLNQRSGISFVWNWEDPNLHSYELNVINEEENGLWDNGIAYGDINNDGFQDFLGVYLFNQSQEKSELFWYINQGDNKTFIATRRYFNHPTNGIRSYRTLKTDVNNDEIADYIFLGVWEIPEENFYNGTFDVLVGKSDGTFDRVNIPNPNGYFIHNGAAGDLNGDGFVDVITASKIWLGDGLGNFTEKENFTLDIYNFSPQVYEIIDIDNDGWNDMILLGPNETTGIILNNEGLFDETNRKISLPSSAFSNVMNFQIIDIDNDNDYDIVAVAHRGGTPSTETNDFSVNVSSIVVYFNENLNFILDEETFSDALDGNYLNGDDDKYGWSAFKFDDVDGDGQDEILAESYHEGTYNGLRKIDDVWKKSIILFD